MRQKEEHLTRWPCLNTGNSDRLLCWGADAE